MTRFDPHAIIKELAKARIRCHGGSMAFKGDNDQQWLCGHKEHAYAGYYEPFEALRVHHHEVTPACLSGCPGWVPESDVDKACWKVHKAHPYLCYANTDEEELRAALEWLNEKVEETP